MQRLRQHARIDAPSAHACGTGSSDMAGHAVDARGGDRDLAVMRAADDGKNGISERLPAITPERIIHRAEQRIERSYAW